MKNKIRSDCQPGDVRPTASQKEKGKEWGWPSFEVSHGYGVFNDYAGGFDYIAKVDDMGTFDGDISAAKQAQRDGYELLPLTHRQKELILAYDSNASVRTILLTRHNVAVLHRIEKKVGK